jgi:hypothetical protein
MKKLKSLNKLKDKFIDMATEFDKLLDETETITNEEHVKILVDEKLKLLTSISINEKLNLDMLKKKYLNISNTDKKDEKQDQEVSLSKDEILDTIIIDNCTYYYQPLNNGKVYNNKSQIVGSYVHNKIIFN